jgi:hypothetical protein
MIQLFQAGLELPSDGSSVCPCADWPSPEPSTDAAAYPWKL